MTSAIGRLIGAYRLDLPLAKGSLGQTMRAQHVRSGEIVAVKLFHEHLTRSPRFAERFQPVVQAAASIEHVNVLRIREFGEQAGDYFIITDFIQAGSLRTLLGQRETRLPLRRALDLARQSADAVAAAHARGVLHRDLKPENFLIREDGATDLVQIADFGLTRLAESGLTIEGSLAFGSLPYMSPEQLRGLPIDARSDLYSLGVVLYEIVTGFPPFQVRNYSDALSKHLSTAPPPPRAVQPGTPTGLEQLILRALEKDPAKRMQTAVEFAGLLQEEINRLPGKPLVVWRGPVTPPVDVRIVAPQLATAMAPPVAAPIAAPVAAPPRAPAYAPPSAIAPAPASRSDMTLPPSAEPIGDAKKLFREPTSDSRRIRVVAERESLVLVPGQLTVLTVTLMNAGRTVDHFSLSIRGVDARWVQTPLQPVQLNPTQRTVIPLSIAAPRTAASRAGVHTMTIAARSRENPAEEGTAAVTLTVQPFAQTAVSLNPPKARGWRRGAFRVTVTNEGNAPARYTLSGQDEENALAYDFTTKTLALEPGESLAVPMSTSVRIKPIGGAEIRTLSVTATPEVTGATEPAKVAAGQFVHRAIIPLWLPPIALAAGAAAFLFISRRNQTSLNVVPAAVQVSVGASAPVVATLVNAKNEAITTGPPVVWSSRDTTVARVSSGGVVTGVHEGNTVLTAKAGKRSQTVQVGVSSAKVDVVAVAPRRLTMTVGDLAVLRATARDAGGNPLPRDPVWISSDPTVVTVGGGKVTAKAAGTATITAQIESKTGTADIQVVERKIGDAPKGPVEDCVAYEPSSLQLAKDKVVGWRVTDGQSTLATLDREAEARQVMALARRYKGHCYIGRANTRPNRSDYIIDYWVAPTNVPSDIPREDCRGYDRASLAIKTIGAAGFSIEDRNGRLLLADTKQDAQRAWDVAKDHLALCTIGRRNGRPNQRDYMVQYWK